MTGLHQASAGHSDRLHVTIIAGSTRPRRKSQNVASWVDGLTAERLDASFEVVGIAEYDLPLFDEPMPPIAGGYRQPDTKNCSQKVASFDAHIFVTLEYNHSTSAALKNGVDHLHAARNDKTTAPVGYGFDGSKGP